MTVRRVPFLADCSGGRIAFNDLLYRRSHCDVGGRLGWTNCQDLDAFVPTVDQRLSSVDEIS